MSAERQGLVLIAVLAGVLIAGSGSAFAGAHGKWAPRYVEDEPEGETVTLIHDSNMKEGESVISVANDNPAPVAESLPETLEVVSEAKSEALAKQAIAEIPAPVNENVKSEASAKTSSPMRRGRGALDSGLRRNDDGSLASDDQKEPVEMISEMPKNTKDKLDVRKADVLERDDNDEGRRDDDAALSESKTGDSLISSADSGESKTDEDEKTVLISSADTPTGARQAEQRQPEKPKKEASPEAPRPIKPQDNGGSVVVDNGQNGETINVGVVSWRDLPFQTVRRQAYDFSCGSAAVATLMTFAYGLPVSEKEVFRDMYVNGDQAKIRREGFSMLDMSNYLNAKGLEAKGYKISADAIAGYRVPFIALINTRGYNHFVVVKSIDNGHVLVGDPNTGNAAYSNEAFSKIWNGLALVVVNNASRSRQAFANADEWRFARSYASPRDANDLSTAAASLPSFNWQVGQINAEMLPAAMANISSTTSTGGNL